MNGQEIGQATYDAPTKVCLEAETVVNELLQKQSQSKEGEINEVKTNSM